MQVWNLLHAARWKHRTQKRRQKSPSGHHRTTLSGYIFTTEARIDNRKKNLLSSDMSSTCSHNMVNFGLLTAEIDPVVWGTPANFNGFRVLAARHLVAGISQTLRRWTEGATCVRQGDHNYVLCAFDIVLVYNLLDCLYIRLPISDVTISKLRVRKIHSSGKVDWTLCMPQVYRWASQHTDV